MPPRSHGAPRCRYSYALDHKRNLLNKAGALNFYGTPIEADLCDNAAQIADESLDFAYCNSIYWVPDPQTALRQIYRKVKPGGYAILEVYTTELYKLDFAALFPALSPHWHEMLSRGRQKTGIGLQSEADWRSMFESGGEAVIEEVLDIEPPVVSQVWNVGLRPIFPVLKRMVTCVPTDTLADIKSEWVKTWVDLLLPMVLEPTQSSATSSRLRLQFIVRKRGDRVA